MQGIVRIRRGTSFTYGRDTVSYKKRLNPPLIRSAEDSNPEIGSEEDHHEDDACLV